MFICEIIPFCVTNINNECVLPTYYFFVPQARSIIVWLWAGDNGGFLWLLNLVLLLVQFGSGLPGLLYMNVGVTSLYYKQLIVLPALMNYSWYNHIIYFSMMFYFAC